MSVDVHPRGSYARGAWWWMAGSRSPPSPGASTAIDHVSVGFDERFQTLNCHWAKGKRVVAGGRRVKKMRASIELVSFAGSIKGLVCRGDLYTRSLNIYIFPKLNRKENF